MTLKYLYAGYAKCGTKTIATACRRLGLKVLDLEEMLLHTPDFWLLYYDKSKTTEERNKILYDMLKDFDIALDTPFYFYWKEILDVFPDCKVIFYERNEDDWYKSHANQAKVNAKFYSIPDPLHRSFLIFCFCLVWVR